VHGQLGEPALTIEGLGVRYGAVVALEDVSCSVAEGELVALVGPNGAGKSTLLRAVLGLVPYDGAIAIHRHDGGALGRAAVAYVPQRLDVELDFPITVEQVVLDGRRPFRRFGRPPTTADRQAVVRAVARVGLDGLESRPIGALSGGQLQRALLARALAQQAGLLLLDEPLAGVDAPTADALIDLLQRLASDGTAIVVCTHDLALVRTRFERAIGLNRRLIADGDPGAMLEGNALEHFFAAP